VQHVAPVTGEIPIEIAERGDGDGEREERGRVEEGVHDLYRDGSVRRPP